MIAAEEGFGADAATEMFTFSHQVVQICFKVFQKSQTEKCQIRVNGVRLRQVAHCFI